MEKSDTVVAVFADHKVAEAAVKKLTAAGFEMKNLSVVGKGWNSRACPRLKQASCSARVTVQ